MSRFVRFAVVVALCATASVLGAGPALAHAGLVGSDPSDGVSLAVPPERVSLRFNEAMQADFSQVTVTGPDGADWHAGAVTTEGSTVGIGLRPLGPAGRYEIGFRVISDDGHAVTGTVAFVLTPPGPAADTTRSAAAAQATPNEAAPVPAVPGEESDAPVWPWLAGAVVLVAAGVVFALRAGRSSR